MLVLLSESFHVWMDGGQPARVKRGKGRPSLSLFGRARGQVTVAYSTTIVARHQREGLCRGVVRAGFAGIICSRPSWQTDVDKLTVWGYRA
jgi:hypothetical protein